jgi:glycosyltransferase involved in cell wall biosynthesis
MHIVFLNPVGTLGGAERILLTAVGALRSLESRPRITVIAAGPGPLLDAARQLGAEVLCLPLPPVLAGLTDSHRASASWLYWCRRTAALGAAVPQYTSRLAKVLAAIAPDVIHSNGLKMHLLAAACRLPRVAIFWHMHDFIGLRRITPWLLRFASKGVTAVAISAAVAADVRRALPGMRIALVPNVVDTDQFRPGRGDGPWLDGLAGLDAVPSDTLRIGLVATFALWKGHDVFLQAAAYLSRDATLPNLRFYIVGGPIYQTQAQRTELELRARASELGLDGRLGFVPFQGDVAPVYRALDIVVHASTQPEPFGLTIAEAMSSGCAVVAANAGGAAELFTPGHDALGVVPGDPLALAGAIRLFVKEPALRLRLGEAARRTALSHFHHGNYGPQLMRLYEAILNIPLTATKAN